MVVPIDDVEKALGTNFAKKVLTINYIDGTSHTESLVPVHLRRVLKQYKASSQIPDMKANPTEFFIIKAIIGEDTTSNDIKSISIKGISHKITYSDKKG